MRRVFSSLRTRVLLLIAMPFAVMLGMIVYAGVLIGTSGFSGWPKMRRRISLP